MTICPEVGGWVEELQPRTQPARPRAMGSRAARLKPVIGNMMDHPSVLK